jgi:hypothetical protein
MGNMVAGGATGRGPPFPHCEDAVGRTDAMSTLGGRWLCAVMPSAVKWGLQPYRESRW